MNQLITLFIIQTFILFFFLYSDSNLSPSTSMNTTAKIEILMKYLQKLYPQAQTELHFSNPYQCLVAVMLSAQTTDKQVNKVTRPLFSSLTKPEDIQNFSLTELEQALQSINYYKNKAKYLQKLSYQLLEVNQKKDFKSLTSQEKQQKTKWGFFIPEEESELVQLAGIGIKNAKVVEAVIFEKATVAVDTHVHRVLNRLNIVQTKTPLETSQKIEKLFPESLKKEANNLIVLFGRYHCTAKNPHCEECELKKWCKLSFKI